MPLDRHGDLWFGSGIFGGSGYGVSRFDGQSFENFTVADGLAHDVVSWIVEDRQGVLWFATEAGVSRFDGNRFESFTTADGLAGDQVTAITLAPDGISTSSAGPTAVMRFESTSSVPRERTSSPCMVTMRAPTKAKEVSGRSVRVSSDRSMPSSGGLGSSSGAPFRNAKVSDRSRVKSTGPIDQ